ncbi:hypothetical protein D3C76_1368730 [compost metagenome]
MTADPQVKRIVPPVRSSYHCPIQLLLPRITRSTKPTTVGGRTSGSSRTVSIRLCPGNFRFAIPLAAAAARRNTTRLVITAIFIDSHTGAIKSVQLMFMHNQPAVL